MEAFRAQLSQAVASFDKDRVQSLLLHAVQQRCNQYSLSGSWQGEKMFCSPSRLAHPASYPMDTGGSFPSVAEIKNE